MWSFSKLPAVLVLLGGCTVHEHYRDGAFVGRTIGFGIVRAAGCHEAPEVVSTRAYGVVLSGRSVSLGFVGTDVTCLPPDDCRSVFFVESDDQAAEIRRLMSGLEEICVQKRS